MQKRPGFFFYLRRRIKWIGRQGCLAFANYLVYVSHFAFYTRFFSLFIFRESSTVARYSHTHSHLSTHTHTFSHFARKLIRNSMYKFNKIYFDYKEEEEEL